ncbi:Uncharacterised protein [Candidatus Anstonella stagnisolia]|nr:Uncharacterised protein [Candidatus Anstonella stagnisolia]
MVSLKKYVPCKCGANNSFDFSSDMSVEDLTICAKCPSCSAGIQITISSLLSGGQQQLPQPSQTSQDVQQVLSENSSSSSSSSANAQDAIHDAQVEENVDTAIREIFKSPF